MRKLTDIAFGALVLQPVFADRSVLVGSFFLFQPLSLAPLLALFPGIRQGFLGGLGRSIQHMILDWLPRWILERNLLPRWGRFGGGRSGFLPWRRLGFLGFILRRPGRHGDPMFGFGSGVGFAATIAIGARRSCAYLMLMPETTDTIYPLAHKLLPQDDRPLNGRGEYLGVRPRRARWFPGRRNCCNGECVLIGCVSSKTRKHKKNIKKT